MGSSDSANSEKPAFPLGTYAVLARVSSGYPPLPGRSPRITHPSATRQPESKLSAAAVRLACVRHAASVQSEPGSNSSVKSFRTTPRGAALTLSPKPRSLPLNNFQGHGHPLRGCLACDSSATPDTSHERPHKIPATCLLKSLRGAQGQPAPVPQSRAFYPLHTGRQARLGRKSTCFPNEHISAGRDGVRSYARRRETRAIRRFPTCTV